VFGTRSFGVGFILHQDIKYFFFLSTESTIFAYPLDLGQDWDSLFQTLGLKKREEKTKD
jgi:hypothetical protein